MPACDFSAGSITSSKPESLSRLNLLKTEIKKTSEVQTILVDSLMSLFCANRFGKSLNLRRRQTNRFCNKTPIDRFLTGEDFTKHRLQEFRVARRDTREQVLLKAAVEPIRVDH